MNKHLRNILILLISVAFITLPGVKPQVSEASSGYILYGDPVTVRYGNFEAGTGNLLPLPATQVAGTITATPGGDSTYGSLILQLKTAGGTTYSNTIYSDIAQGASKTWRWLSAYPGSTSAVTCDTSGHLGTAALATGTVGGSGTDNHIMRWDGTTNAQDTGWVIDDGDTMTAGTTATIAFVPATGQIASRALDGIGDVMFSTGELSDSTPRFRIDSNGVLGWGSGAATQDIGLSRLAANLLGLSAGDAFVIGSTAGDHASTTDGTISYNSSTNHLRGYINGAWKDLDDVSGRKSIMLMAAQMWTSTTSACTGPTKTETATNKQNMQTLGFQGVAGKTYAEYTTVMPDNYDGGSLYATFYWSANNTNTNGVRWGLECRSYGNAETIDQAWGTAQEVTDTESGTAVQNMISAETAAITPSGSPAGGELLQIRVYRDASNGGDTEFGSVDLMAVKLEYSVATFGE